MGSKHHLVLRGFSTSLGEENLRWQTSLGMMVHSWAGFNLGTNLVWNLQVFWGFKSQTSSGTSIREVMVLSWHSSSPSVVTQPAPQISTGNFSQEVSPTNLPKKKKHYVSGLSWLCFQSWINKGWVIKIAKVAIGNKTTNFDILSNFDQKLYVPEILFCFVSESNFFKRNHWTFEEKKYQWENVLY